MDNKQFTLEELIYIEDIFKDELGPLGHRIYKKTINLVEEELDRIDENNIPFNDDMEKALTLLKKQLEVALRQLLNDDLSDDKQFYLKHKKLGGEEFGYLNVYVKSPYFEYLLNDKVDESPYQTKFYNDDLKLLKRDLGEEYIENNFEKIEVEE